MNPSYHYHHYHTPPPRESTRVRCPVCNEEVYSRAGIHPQCAVRQSDPPTPKNKGQKSRASGEAASVTIKADGAVLVQKPRAGMRTFDPDRISV
jgi:hypothetical protein